MPANYAARSRPHRASSSRARSTAPGLAPRGRPSQLDRKCSDRALRRRYTERGLTSGGRQWVEDRCYSSSKFSVAEPAPSFDDSHTPLQEKCRGISRAIIEKAENSFRLLNGVGATTSRSHPHRRGEVGRMPSPKHDAATPAPPATLGPSF